MNLSSIVIQTRPENVNKVVDQIKNSSFCEYHMHDEKGRIIVTIEGKDTEEEVVKLKQIQEMSLVVSAEMVFAYSEEELEREKENLEKTGNNIPPWLNDPNVKSNEIRYGGDLKGRF